MSFSVGSMRRAGTGAGRRFHELRTVAPDIHAEFDRLGVRHAFALEPTEKHPPGFYVMPNMLSWPRSPKGGRGRKLTGFLGRFDVLD